MVNYTIIYPEYLDCIKQDNSKLINFYYIETIDQYRPCFKTCKRCLLGGNPEAHDCLESAPGYMFRTGDNPHNNCALYSEYYYMSAYRQYKSLKIFQCQKKQNMPLKIKKFVFMIVEMTKNINIYLMEIVLKNVLLEKQTIIIFVKLILVNTLWEKMN